MRWLYASAATIHHPELHAVFHANVAEFDHVDRDDRDFGNHVHPTAELRCYTG
jgi:hypothetical protein